MSSSTDPTDNINEQLMHFLNQIRWQGGWPTTDHEQMCVLLDKGADEEGSTALMFATQWGGRYAEEMIRLLIDAGADTNNQDKDGWTALMFAVREVDEHGLSMMRLLLDKGADANKQDEYGWTALIMAARYGGEHGLSMMRLLVDAGADANKKNKHGWTALIMAARHGGEHILSMIQLLVNAGADINIKGKNNKTAYDIAVEKNNKIAVDILKQYQDNWTFKWTTADKLQLKLWSAQNIKVATTILLCQEKSYLSKIPLDLIRAYILPMTIDRRDTIKEEEKMTRPSKRLKTG